MDLAGERMLDLMRVASASDRPVVIMNIRVQFKFKGPAEMQIYHRVGTTVLTRLDATLLSGIDPPDRS